MKKKNSEELASEGSGSEATAPRLARLGDLTGDWVADAERRYQAKRDGVSPGPVTGFMGLDRYVGGYLAPGLHTITGPPAAGKTAFGLQAAAQCGFPSLIVTCEMSPIELTRRIVARETQTYLGRLKSGELSPAEMKDLLQQTIEELPGLHLCDATRSFASPKFLSDAARVARGEASNILLVIDSVHSWVQHGGKDSSEYEQLNAGVRALQALASELECPIVAIVERSRASMGGGLSAGAGTRKFEYAAETVVSLDVEKQPGETRVKPDAAGETPIILTVEKNRNGSAGRRFRMKFHGAQQQFREVK